MIVKKANLTHIFTLTPEDDGPCAPGSVVLS